MTNQRELELRRTIMQLQKDVKEFREFEDIPYPVETKRFTTLAIYNTNSLISMLEVEIELETEI
mgnify:CR=1 FL=1